MRRTIVDTRELLHAIAIGKLKPGQSLPLHDAEKYLHIRKETARSVLQHLTADGVIGTNFDGTRFFIAPAPLDGPTLANAMLQDMRTNTLQAGEHFTPGDVAARYDAPMRSVHHALYLLKSVGAVTLGVHRTVTVNPCVDVPPAFTPATLPTLSWNSGRKHEADANVRMVAETIAHQIRTGILRPGTRIGKTWVAERFDVTNAVAIKALQCLVEDEVIPPIDGAHPAVVPHPDGAAASLKDVVAQQLKEMLEQHPHERGTQLSLVALGRRFKVSSKPMIEAAALLVEQGVLATDWNGRRYFVGEAPLGPDHVVNDVKQRIAQEAIAPGDALWVNELIAHYGVTESAARSAERQLRHEGLVVRNPQGRGGVVAEHITLSMLQPTPASAFVKGRSASL